MPLTVTPDESEERRRKLYGDFAASNKAAMGYGFDALSKMEAMAKDKAATARQATLDGEARAKAAADLTLRNHAAGIDDNAEERAQAKHDYEMPRLQKRDAQADEDRTLTLDDSKRKRTQETIARTVANGIALQKSPRALAAENPDLDPNEIAAAYERAQHSSLLDDKKRDLDARKAEAEITDKLRPKGGGAPRPKTPEDIERQKKKDALLDAQLRNTNARTDVATGEKPRKLTAGDTMGLADAKSAISRITNLRGLKKKVNTGQLAGRVQKGLANVTEQKDWRAFNTLNSMAVRQIGKALEGGRMTDSDAKAYEAILMDPNSDENEYDGVLSVIEDDLRLVHGGQIEALEGAKFDVPSSVRVEPSGSSVGRAAEPIDPASIEW